ncbi:MAG: hypothetical protein JO036_02610 [Candidatus Eremiobacteraeota bacterium]|nr:hypothetical protein [Candidatus Eremiobacteraeota bacterium]
MGELLTQIQIDHVKELIKKLEPEERIRLRAWIGARYDGCGFERSDEVADSPLSLYFVRDFEHEDMREVKPAGFRAGQKRTWNVPGIYAIATDVDWLYVGRATKLAIRRTNHASTLRNNTHQNRLLQRHWNVTSDPMWFVVLERWPNTISRFRRGSGEHPRELLWKSRLRPLYDREGRKADISFLITP